MYIYNFTEDERVEKLLKENRPYEAAKYCFCAETSTKAMIMVIEEFTKKRKIKIETRNLFLLQKQTLKCLLCHCINTEGGENTPIIIVTKKKSKEFKTIIF